MSGDQQPPLNYNTESENMTKDIYDAYVSDGWHIFQLYKTKNGDGNAVKGLYATPKGWNDTDVKWPYKPDAVYGGVPPSDMVAIDWDVKNGLKSGDKSFAKLQKDLKCKIENVVCTPSGGGHAYVRIKGLPEETPKLRKAQPNYPDIEFQSHGSEFVVLGGQKVEGYGEYKFADEDFEYFVNDTIDFSSLELRAVREQGDGYDSVDDFEHIAGRPPLEDIKALLAKISPDCDHDSGWQTVGMALNNWDLNGEVGEQLFVEWSLGSQKYVDEQGEDAIRAGAIKKYSECVADSPEFYNKLFTLANNEDLKKINARLSTLQVADDFEELAEYASKSFITNEERVRIADELAVKEKDLGLTDRKSRKKWSDKLSKSITLETADDSSINWAYVDSEKTYVRLDTYETMTDTAINIKFYEAGSKISAVAKLKADNKVHVVHHREYRPDRESEQLFMNRYDESVLNNYRPLYSTVAKAELTHEDEVMIEKIMNHYRLILGEDETKFIVQWLAWQIQNKGVLLGWVPLILGGHGLGKSLLFLITQSALGTRNAVQIMPEAVQDQNKAHWASGHCVVAFEELHLSGHNRHEVANALKPYITEEQIHVTDKWVKGHYVTNTTNYIAFSNYPKPVPLTETERRWWVTRLNYESLETFKKDIDEDLHVYFKSMRDYISNNGDALKKWLMDVEITPEFKATRYAAPKTRAFHSIVAMEQDSSDGYTDVMEVLTEGGEGFTREVFSSSMLCGQLLMDGVVKPEDVETTKRNILFTKMGYIKHPSQVKWRNKKHSVWYRRNMENAEIREVLEATMPPETSDTNL